jgi:hypothetical protein
MELPVRGADEGRRTSSWLLFSEPTSQSAFFWPLSARARCAPICCGRRLFARASWSASFSWRGISWPFWCALISSS